MSTVYFVIAMRGTKEIDIKEVKTIDQLAKWVNFFSAYGYAVKVESF